MFKQLIPLGFISWDMLYILAKIKKISTKFNKVCLTRCAFHTILAVNNDKAEGVTKIMGTASFVK